MRVTRTLGSSHLIQYKFLFGHERLSENIKKRREEGHICYLIAEVVLVIQKLIVMSEIKTDILRITYSIFNILIPKSVLVFFAFALTLFDDTNLIIARLESVIYRLPFWLLPR